MSIPGYEDYKVSDQGRVKSLKFGKEKILEPILNKEYLKVNLFKNCKKKNYTVHNLVAITFLDHIPNRMEGVIDHINGIKTDNSLKNLRIVSQRENTTFGWLKKETSSKYPGVCMRKNSKKWRSCIYINGKQKHLGYFDTEELASRAYQDKLKELNEFRNPSN
jgi:hypothetical protein